MQKTLHQALAAACIALAAGGAQATASPLSNAIISASMNGDASDMLGLDHGFDTVPGSNVSGLDPTDIGAEFLNGAMTLAFDFTADGHLNVYNNNPVPAGVYVATFDFGATLAAPITGFSLVDASQVGGVPLLTIINGHTISVDLSGVTWNDLYTSFSTSITLQAATTPTSPVPEPATGSMLLAGLGALGTLSLRRRARDTQG